MNKPCQCRCPFQLISDIHQCHISPCKPSVINHLQQSSHSQLGISEHAAGKVAALVILLMSLFIQIFTILCLRKRGTSAQTCQITQTNQSTAQEPMHRHAASQGLLPTPLLTAFHLCPTPTSPQTSKKAPGSGNNPWLLQFLLD